MNSEPKAWIVTVGNELLVGRIVNTNAAWLARKLTLLGYRVERIITVPDNVNDIAEEVGRGVARAGVVVTTGGLGPTYDDVTLEGVARALGRRLVLNNDALAMVENFYSSRGLSLTPERRKMAMLPEGAKPIPNPVGAAPGSLLEVDEVLVVSLPGVPREMQEMFERHVEPLLRKRAPPRAIVECSVEIRGVPESTLAPHIKEAAKKHSRVYLKSHPKGHETKHPILEIKALASAPSEDEALNEARSAVEVVAEAARRLGGVVSNVNCVRQA